VTPDSGHRWHVVCPELRTARRLSLLRVPAFPALRRRLGHSYYGYNQKAAPASSGAHQAAQKCRDLLDHAVALAGEVQMAEGDDDSDDEGEESELLKAHDRVPFNERLKTAGTIAAYLLGMRQATASASRRAARITGKTRLRLVTKD
jgi:hypothetical protein